ncbi:MAG TPA: hypothetical protein VH600_13235 [Burkholderiales bacterium]
MVGLFAAGRLAAKHSERYAEDVLSYSRYIQAKERANLVRLLENNEVQRAEELLYIVLRDNFKDFSDNPDSEKRARACELLKVLRPGFVASAQGTGHEQPESRRALVETIRSATASCDAGAK